MNEFVCVNCGHRDRTLVNLNSPYECYWSRRALAAEEELAKRTDVVTIHPDGSRTPEKAKVLTEVLDIEVTVVGEKPSTALATVGEVGYVQGAHSFSVLTKRQIQLLNLETGDTLKFSGMNPYSSIGTDFDVLITKMEGLDSDEQRRVHWRIL